MKKKDSLLTFVCACVPGAGQMYYGYMKRGLSLITYFCLSIAIGAYVSPVLVAALIVWMYSYFDTYDLIRYMAAGEPKEDGFLIPPGLENMKSDDGQSLGTILPGKHKLIGWGCILLGVWVLFGNVISPVLTMVFDVLGLSSVWYQIYRNAPSLAVAIVLVYAGTRMLGLGGPRSKTNDTDDLPPYQGQ